MVFFFWVQCKKKRPWGDFLNKKEFFVSFSLVLDFDARRDLKNFGSRNWIPTEFSLAFASQTLAPATGTGSTGAAAAFAKATVRKRGEASLKNTWKYLFFVFCFNFYGPTRTLNQRTIPHNSQGFLLKKSFGQKTFECRARETFLLAGGQWF